MEYQIYKLVFTTSVHFGKHSLEDASNTFLADTFFSAMCQECVKQGGQKLEELVRRARRGSIRISDAFPYIGDTYYLPKPMLKIEAGQGQGDSSLKKAYKKLSYVPAQKLEEYLAGELDVKMEANRLKEHLGQAELRAIAAVRGMEEAMPYQIGIYAFYPGSGLYVIAGYETKEDAAFAEQSIEALPLSGIGGKRTAGLGRFLLEREEVPDDWKGRLVRGQLQGALKPKREEAARYREEPLGSGKPVYMSLSACLPKDEELGTSLTHASYLLARRGGFVASEVYAKEPRRKRDLYVMQAGSCFQERFEGDIYDVSAGGSHPVYRYAKPLWMEVAP
ncbi:type III-A CRISPR-associated RAMP protein Csm4 [Lachnospiraceae bacterium 29-84]